MDPSNSPRRLSGALAEFIDRDTVVWRQICKENDDKKYVSLGVVLGNEALILAEKSPDFGNSLQPGMSSFKVILSRLILSTNSWEDVHVSAERPGIRAGATLSAINESRAVLFGGYCDGRIFDEMWFLEIKQHDYEHHET